MSERTTPHVDLPWDELLPNAYALTGGSVPGAFDEQLTLIGQAIAEAAERYGLETEAVAKQLGRGIPVAETMRGSIERAARAVVILDGSAEDVEQLFSSNRDDATDEIREWFHWEFDREIDAVAERYGVSPDAIAERVETEDDVRTLRQAIDHAGQAVAEDRDPG